MTCIKFRFSVGQPCPVCGSGTKSCSATDDGLHFCRGEAGDGWYKLGEDDTGFGHYRRDEERFAKYTGQTAKSGPADGGRRTG